jgi:polyphosphate kinase
MLKPILMGGLLLAFCACTSQPSSSTGSTGLKKVRYRTPEELQKLRAAGAEIIVQQSDYVIVRVDSTNVSALAAAAVEPMQESDLVQRLVHIKIDSAHTVQQIVDAGLDLWEAAGDTAVARAYDIQLERLRQTGFELRVIAQDANQSKGGRE